MVHVGSVRRAKPASHCEFLSQARRLSAREDANLPKRWIALQLAPTVKVSPPLSRYGTLRFPAEDFLRWIVARFSCPPAPVAGGVTPALPAARAAQIDKVEFSDRLRAGSVMLRLSGAGLVYYKAIIKGVAACLYLDESARPQDVLADVAKRVEIEYFWALKGKTIAAALARPLADNLSAERLAAIQADVDRLHAAMVDVQPGDRYALTYLPGVGTWLSHNGRTLVTIPGAEFAASYFSIWFGEKPMDARLKRQLLGG